LDGGLMSVQKEKSDLVHHAERFAAGGEIASTSSWLARLVALTGALVPPNLHRAPAYQAHSSDRAPG
jgi:hypothetical protein